MEAFDKRVHRATDVSFAVSQTPSPPDPTIRGSPCPSPQGLSPRSLSPPSPEPPLVPNQATGPAADASSIRSPRRSATRRWCGCGDCRMHEVKANILAKLEFFNPAASVKDRIGVAMIEALEARRADRPGHGADRADLRQHRHCARLRRGGARLPPDPGDAGSRCRSSAARCLKLLGAELVLTPAAARHARRGRKGRGTGPENPDAVMPQQFKNPANPEIHRLTTAEEIWNDTGGEIDVFVSGVGTGGTITGVGPGAEAAQASLRIIAVEPQDSPVLSGGQPGPHKIQGIGAGFIPDILDRSVIDEVVTVTNDDQRSTRRALLARHRRHSGRHFLRRRGRGRAGGRRAGPAWRARTSSSSCRPSPSAISRPRCSRTCDRDLAGGARRLGGGRPTRCGRAHCGQVHCAQK